LRTRPGLRDKHRRQAGAGPVEAANRGRGVLVQLAHSLNNVTNTGYLKSTTASGIYATSATAAPGTVSAKNYSKISAGTYGMLVKNTGSGAATVVNTGDITTSATLIGKSDLVATANSGNVSIQNSGYLKSTLQGGIVAINTGAGSVGVTNTNKITSFFEGIYAKSTTGAITVQSTGDVTSSSSAIKTVGGASSAVTVKAGSTVYGYLSAVESPPVAPTR
jgi:hypothetical protein